MIKSEVLMSYLWEKHISPEELAKALQISEHELFKKIYITKRFSLEEKKLIIKILNLFDF